MEAVATVAEDRPEFLEDAGQPISLGPPSQGQWNTNTNLMVAAEGGGSLWIGIRLYRLKQDTLQTRDYWFSFDFSKKGERLRPTARFVGSPVRHTFTITASAKVTFGTDYGMEIDLDIVETMVLNLKMRVEVRIARTKNRPPHFKIPSREVYDDETSGNPRRIPYKYKNRDRPVWVLVRVHLANGTYTHSRDVEQGASDLDFVKMEDW